MMIEIFLRKVVSKMMEEISPENLMKRTGHLWRKYIPREVSVIAGVKSSVPMLKCLTEEGYEIKRGIVITTKEWERMAKNFDDVEVFVSSHPIPDEMSLKAAQSAIEILKKEEFVLFLISGEGSLFLEFPALVLADNGRLVKGPFAPGWNFLG